MKRYLAVVGIILVVLVSLGVWLKPPLEKMREGVEIALTEYAKTKLKPGGVLPAVSHVESRDWVLAVSHVAKVGDLTFSCVGAFKVTVCDYPE